MEQWFKEATHDDDPVRTPHRVARIMLPGVATVSSPRRTRCSPARAGRVLTQHHAVRPRQDVPVLPEYMVQKIHDLTDGNSIAGGLSAAAMAEQATAGDGPGAREPRVSQRAVNLWLWLKVRSAGAPRRAREAGLTSAL